jgi:hypothetical protein
MKQSRLINFEPMIKCLYKHIIALINFDAS